MCVCAQGTSRTLKLTGDLDYRAMARQAEAELKEIAKEEAARAAQTFDQAVEHCHNVERVNLVSAECVGQQGLYTALC